MIPIKGELPDKDTIGPETPGMSAEIVVPGVEVTEAGEAGGIGGLGSVIWRVFAENKLALISIGGIVLIVIAAILHTSFWLIVFIVALAAWLVPARLIRGETLTLRTREYVQAVRAMGGGGGRIVVRHIIPNAVGTIIVNATFQIADAIGFLAALGFLGFGVPPPGTSWGQMLSDGISYAQEGAWWLIYPARICIILITVSFNYIGDALRDAFEVRLQRR